MPTSPLAPATLALSLALGCQWAPPAASPAPPAPVAAVPASTPDIASIVAKVRPAVVDVIAIRSFGPPKQGRPPAEGTPKGQGGRVAPWDEPDLAQRGLGSGFIVDADGHVVTNSHVVDGAVAVRVRLADDRELEATIKGQDPWLDVAVLELRGAKDLPSTTLGHSEALRVGDPVIAIGNPYGLGSTVTMGIVSAKGREIGSGPYDDFLQTDASINPGNSGGPLIDRQGQVVGVNTAIHPRGKGLGFAIPIDDVKDVLPQLLARGRVARGMLGVLVQPRDRSTGGAWVTEVEKGSPAERSGLRAGDLIVSIDGAPVTRQRDLPRLVARRAPGSRVAVGIVRQGGRRTIEVTLGKLGVAASVPPPAVEDTAGTDLGAPACEVQRPTDRRRARIKL